MPNVITRDVRCEECDEKTLFFTQLGFQVLDCEPLPGPGEMCRISMTDPKLEAAASADMVPPGAPMAARTFPAGASVAGSGGLTATQVRTAQAIVNVFETSTVLGDYSKVTLLAGDTGHLTYGRSQTTLASGNLALLVDRYVANSASRWARRLVPFQARLRQRDLTLDKDLILANILRACADDAVMRDTQDAFFDATYWQTAVRDAERTGIALPLGMAIVYDSLVHGSYGLMRDRTVAAIGKPVQAGERPWLTHYVQTRRDWLATHSNKLLRATTYRMDAFQRLIELEAWGLELPLVVRGQEISLATLAGAPPGCYDGPQPGTRALALQGPMLRGLDVRLVQVSLSDRGFPIRADGIYGRSSRDLVMAFQTRQGQSPSGALDADAIARLVQAVIG